MVPATVSRHDLALAAIALSLVTAAVLGVVSSLGLPVALGAGSIPATGSLGYALFYRPPGERTDGE